MSEKKPDPAALLAWGDIHRYGAAMNDERQKELREYAASRFEAAANSTHDQGVAQWLRAMAQRERGEG